MSRAGLSELIFRLFRKTCSTLFLSRLKSLSCLPFLPTATVIHHRGAFTRPTTSRNLHPCFLLVEILHPTQKGITVAVLCPVGLSKMAGIRITKLSNKARATTTTPLSLFSLPPELRSMIYQHYLQDLFPCRDQSVYGNMITDKIDNVPLLHINTQVYSEVQEAVKKPNEGLAVELSWQGLRIDPLTVLRMRFRSKGKKWRINALPYLRIKIFAPHPKRPTDIICLWHYAKALCDQLRGYPRIPRLIIDFQESTDFAEDLSSRSTRPSWSKTEDESLPKKSIEHEQLDFWECDTFPKCFCQDDTYKKDDLEGTCDVKYILDAFSLLTTALAVEINLPPSLATNGKLRTIAQQRIDAMMNRRTPLFDPNAYGQAMALFLASSSTALIHQTGQNSFQQLVRLSQQDGA